MDCSDDDLDPREVQCSQYDGINFSFKDLGDNVKWLPKYGLSKADECRLYCRVEGHLNYFNLPATVTKS